MPQPRIHLAADLSTLLAFHADPTSSHLPLRLLLLHLTEARFPHGPICPHCAHRRVHRWGTSRQRQRYRCTRCRRTFTPFTRSPLARTRYPDKWPAFARCLVAGRSVRATARRLRIAPSTAFRWRHRLLAALHALPPHRLEGIVELTETAFRASAKGSRRLNRPARERGEWPWRPLPEGERVEVLLARDRRGEVAATRLEDRSWTAVRAALLPRLGSDVVLCADRAHPYRWLCRWEGVADAAARRRGSWWRWEPLHHVRNVRRLAMRLRRWLRRFRGVATRYLPHYLTWFVWLGRVRRPQELLYRALAAAPSG